MRKHRTPRCPAPQRGRQGRDPRQGHLPGRAVRPGSSRRGHAKATVAVEHSILVAVFHILDRNVLYADLGADWFLRRNDLARHAERLARQIRALGYNVTLTTTTPAA